MPLLKPELTMGPMNADIEEALRKVSALVDEYRSECLWFLRPDYYPGSIDEAMRVLESIEIHGDVTAFKRAAELRQWFLRRFSEKS